MPTPVDNVGNNNNMPLSGGVARSLSFGDKAVGLTFNPSGDAKVAKLKSLYAEIIDTLSDGNLDNGASDLKGRILGRAINDAIGAQMWAVKAVTWKD